MEKTIEFFVELFGQAAGNAGLMYLPTGGMYLLGGLSDKFQDLIVESDIWKKAFFDKGRLSEVLENLPVFLVKDIDLNMKGCIEYCRRLIEENLEKNEMEKKKENKDNNENNDNEEEKKLDVEEEKKEEKNEEKKEKKKEKKKNEDSEKKMIKTFHHKLHAKRFSKTNKTKPKKEEKKIEEEKYDEKNFII